MDLVVIGGGAAGMAAASKAKRVDPSLSVTVIEAGRYVSYAECGIPYFLEGIVTSPDQLLHYPLEEFTTRRGINVITGTSVNVIDRKNRVLVLSNSSKVKYDRLIIATGASPKVPDSLSALGIRGIRSLESGEITHNDIAKAETVAIIGDGILGIELASSLVLGGKKVFVVSRHKDILKAFDSKIGAAFREEFKQRVSVLTEASDLEVTRRNGSFVLATSGREYAVDAVISATGIVPNTKIAVDAGIATDSRGIIITDGRMLTSDPSIYSAGDCASTTNLVTGKQDWHPLAQISNKMGRVAGANAAGGRMVFPGSVGTTLVKVFDYEIGFTGLTEEQAKKDGLDAKTIFVKGMSKAGYYPGKHPVFVTMVTENVTGRMLGAQVVSKDGAAWRVNAVAAAIQARLTAEAFFYTDLGYSPPFGPVWDPLIVAADLSMK
ncbi:MAG: FAD-dependent oxidoreductase [Candidatus Thermoplasmatota archaeon]|nr:FAD-dependent oxidoreductase [Candidatus Thermoplasmatota archaeon]